MKLSELFAKIGDEKIKFQNLDNDIVRLSTKSDGSSEVTFGTKAQTTLNGTKALGLVVWLDRDEVERALEGEG